MQSVTNIVELRQLLAERFPHVRMRLGGRRKAAVCWPTGISQLDGLLQGGLPQSALTELVGPRLSSGSAVVVQALIRVAARRRQWVALVDGQDCFDAAGLANAELGRLLWVRCRDAAQAVKAADFLVRDGNLSLVILDLRLNQQLQKVPSAAWYRLQRCLEPRATAFLVVTPRPMVGAAHVRLRLKNQFTLAALAQPGRALLAQLKFECVRLHGLEQDQAMAEAG